MYFGAIASVSLRLAFTGCDGQLEEDSRNYRANPSQFAGLLACLLALLVCFAWLGWAITMDSVGAKMDNKWPVEGENSHTLLVICSPSLSHVLSIFAPTLSIVICISLERGNGLEREEMVLGGTMAQVTGHPVTGDRLKKTGRAVPALWSC
jgi:hypothetical protein